MNTNKKRHLIMTKRFLKDQIEYNKERARELEQHIPKAVDTLTEISIYERAKSSTDVQIKRFKLLLSEVTEAMEALNEQV